MQVIAYAQQPTAFLTSELKDIQELGEALGTYGPLGDDDEVVVEISAPWSVIRELLFDPKFADVWFKPKQEVVEMTLELPKAIEILIHFLGTHRLDDEPDRQAAVKIGVEAIKRCKVLAENDSLWAAKPLPGETKE